MARRVVLTVIGSALVVGAGAAESWAGEYAVANCKADSGRYSTDAFAASASPGTRVVRACDPHGAGLRGLITKNVSGVGQVPAGSRAAAVITAPPGTRFKTLVWAGSLDRRDCRWALQLYADAPGQRTTPLVTKPANQDCPRTPTAQDSGIRRRVFDVAGATRIVQRTVCAGAGKRDACSTRGTNYLRTHEAKVTIEDVQPPTAAIVGDTPLATGAWVSGTQPLNYDANDNVGVRSAEVYGASRRGGNHDRPCATTALSRDAVAFTRVIPCPNGPGQMTVFTQNLSEGTQPLALQARDTAGNLGTSPLVTARIDNTPPPRADVGVAGGVAWRNRNGFLLQWSNPPEPDRAPIVGVDYALCRAGGGACIRGTRTGAGLNRMGLALPAPGDWTLSLWRRDAAGNASELAASVPVPLRFDPDPPQLAFTPQAAADPALVSVVATDPVSGLGGGSIEMSASGSGIWQAVPTQRVGQRLVARIDDGALPPGGYQLRARAADQAGNEASTDRRQDGEPMALTLPLRAATRMRAGFPRSWTIRRTVLRGGERRTVRRRITRLRAARRMGFDGAAVVRGRLADREGRVLVGVPVEVWSRSVTTPDQHVATTQTDARGLFTYRVDGTTSRTLRFRYPGTRAVLPVERTVAVKVPARTSLRPNRHRLRNGQAVTFIGRLRTLPVPAAGKLVELQVRFASGWSTFRTVRTDARGRWRTRYRFQRTSGDLRYLFRARLPVEAGYPYEAGGSPRISVRVRGRR